MPRSVRMYLADVSNSCNEIVELVRGRTFEEFAIDRSLRPAVERHLSIIGEALYCAAKQQPSLSEQITSFPQIIALRHRLVHGYFSTSQEIIWHIVTDNVPTLQTQIETMLQTNS